MIRTESEGTAVYVITTGGIATASRIKESLPDCDIFLSERFTDSGRCGMPDGTAYTKLLKPFRKQIAENWTKYRSHIFLFSIGATVRLIKDLIRDKYHDPAVICIDNNAEYVIPVLSGHVGGANELTLHLAEHLSAVPVITTASDCRKTVAPDILGREYGWTVEDSNNLLTAAAASIVNDEPVAVVLECGENALSKFSPLPGNFTVTADPASLSPDGYNAVLFVTDRLIKEDCPELYKKAVIYRPKTLAVGIGCDRNTGEEILYDGLQKILKDNKLSINSVKCLVSVDKKADEAGLISLSERLRIPFITYPADELDKVEGIENPSETARKYVGTRSVAEAASLKYADSKTLLVPKTVYTPGENEKNMTCAVSRIKEDEK